MDSKRLSKIISFGIAVCAVVAVGADALMLAIVLAFLAIFALFFPDAVYSILERAEDRIKTAFN
jgi:hypothetical protein